MDSLNVFEALPPDWTVFLDPGSFLKLQSANRGPFLNTRFVEVYWSGICRCHLEHFINAEGSYTIELRFDASTSGQPLQKPAGSEECSFVANLSSQRRWKHLFLDLVGPSCESRRMTEEFERNDLDSDSEGNPELATEANHSPAARLHPGSLCTTAGNELRHDLGDFRFPMLPDARATPEIHVANLLRELGISADDFGRFTCCHLQSPLGGDRCVMAKYPLAWQGAATACAVDSRPQLPNGRSEVSSRPSRPVWRWCVDRRSCAYYEVEIRHAAIERARPVRELPGGHCVSIGLALATIPLRGLCRQQAGWNPHSWALHGDDGQMYHGHGQGQRFQPIWISQSDSTQVAGAAAGKHQEQAKTAKIPKFSVGDVIGCGVCRLDAPGHFGIFFALNGEFLGVCFPVFATVEPRFFPCVGIDTPFELCFNFGCKPFCLDLKAHHNLQPVYGSRYAARCADVSTRVMEFPNSHWPGTDVTEEAEDISIEDSDTSNDSDSNGTRRERAREQRSASSSYTRSPDWDTL